MNLRKSVSVWVGISFSVCVFLLTGETAARIIKLDTLMIKPLLRDMPIHPECHQPSSNLNLLYELKPGVKKVYDQIKPGQIVEINEFGFRDGPRVKEKSPRCLRIFCFGASTVYGHAVNNDQTYPHYLEQVLNDKLKKSHITVEVWNAGVAGSVLRQNAEIAKRAMENYSPDILVFFYTNQWGRSLLADRPFDHYFREDPSLFWENARFVPYCKTAAGRFMFDRSYFWRSIVISVNYLMTVKTNNDIFLDENRNLEAISEICRVYGEKVPIFMIPFLGHAFRIPEIKATGAKIINLFDAQNLPARCGPEYFEIHPPPHVYRWYADVIAKQLDAAGVLKLNPVGH